MKKMQPQPNITIRLFKISDFHQVQEIYKQGVETRNATFESHIPFWEEWNRKFIEEPRLVAVLNDRVVGWAMLSRVSLRDVYSGVCEISLYIHKKYRKRGIGKALLNELITQSENYNIWTLQAGIFPENKVSIKLHKDCGFREVGYREKIGKMDDEWRDTILLERRSKEVGLT